MRFKLEQCRLPGWCGDRATGRGVSLNPTHCLNPHPTWQFCLHPWHAESHICEGRHLNSLGIMTLKKKSYAAPGNENYKYSNLRKGRCIGQKIKVLDNCQGIWNVKFSKDSNLHCEQIHHPLKKAQGKHPFVYLFQ